LINPCTMSRRTGITDLLMKIHFTDSLLQESRDESSETMLS